MPLYEYKCSECGTCFEKIESFNADHCTECPTCGSTAKRLVSLGSFVLKGSGWYATDHASRSRSGQSESKPPDCGSSCDSCCTASQKSA